MGASQSCPNCGAPSRGYRYCGQCGARIGDPVSLTERTTPAAGVGAAGPRSSAAPNPPAGPEVRSAGARRLRVVLVVSVLVAALVGGAYAVGQLQDPATGQAGDADTEVRLPAEMEEDADDAAEGAGDDERPPIECLELASCLRWQAPLEVSPQQNLRIDAADDALVVSSHGHVEVVDLTGRRRWTHEAADPSDWGGPAFVAGDLVLVLASESLVALDLDSGEQRWRRRLPERGLQPLSPLPGRVGDTLLVSLGRPNSGRDGPTPVTLYGLDPDTGEERWTRDADQASVAGATLAVLAGDELAGVDPATGEPRWRVTPSWPGGLEPGTRIPAPPMPGDAGPEGREDNGGDEGDEDMMEVHPWLLSTSRHVTLVGSMADRDAPEMVVIDTATGDELTTGPGQPMHGGDRLLLTRTGEEGRTLTALDDEAEVAWEHTFEDDAENCCTRVQVGPGGVSLLGPGDRMRVLDPEDGTVRHETALGLEVNPASHLEVANDDSAVLHTGPSPGSRDREARGIDLATESQLWRVEGAAPASRVTPELYLVVWNGTLQALELPGS